MVNLVRRHPFHLVDQSPWPFLAGMSSLSVTTGFVMYMHCYQGGFLLFSFGFFSLLVTFFVWWRDIIREATFQGHHTKAVQDGLTWGMLLFIASEVMFFFAFFWAFYSACISRSLALAAGSFDESLKSVEDWDFWIRAVKAGGTQKIISEKLVYYRYAKNSMSRDGFVMFDALKKVIERGPKKDTRIVIESSLNKDYNFDINSVLQKVLIRSLGVGIMQGKIQKCLEFFKSETTKDLSQHTSKEFELMCSYLSFRYWYSKSDIEEVFTLYYPNFERFFDEAGYSKSFKRKALYYIFKRHLFHRNINSYGKNLGRFFNSIIRNFNEKIVLL